MKLKRMIASVLTLLLMVSLLPIGVMADTVDNNPAGNTVPEITSGNTMEVNAGTVDTNDGTVKCNLGHVETNNKNVNTNSGIVTTNEGKVITNGTKGTVTTNKKDVTYNQGNVETNAKTGTVKYNGGKITTNEGTVNKNDTIINSAGVELKGVIETNKGTIIENNKGCTVKTNAEGGTVQTNQGLVETNNNKVTTNSGIVTTNKGEVTTNGTKGTLTTNEKDVTYNKGNVVTNAATGTVDKNWGNITTNNGTVNTNKTIKDKDGVEFKGVIETNKGTVKTNGEGGTVETNAKGGEIETNNGTVGKKDKDGNAVAGTGNNGTIETNNGTVITNNETGTVENNAKNGKIETNYGKIETNNGYVEQNTGTVETNNWVMLQNNGTVETNNQYVKQNTGTVETNKSGVYLNNGTVETNKEMVDRNNGTVVTNAIDGFVGNGFNKESAEYGLKDSEENEASPEKGGVVEKNFGTVYDYTKPDGKDGLTIYYGLSWGENTDHLNLIDGAVKAETEKNLDEIASSVTRDGYRMTGFTAFYRLGGENQEITKGTNHYTMNAPTWLKILWEKIVTAVESNEPEAKKTSTPTTLSADQVKVGAYVRQGNLLFRIIEVNDDSIRVVIVGKLSEQALADMLGFLKQHLSDAQIAKINGEPELLEQELVTYFIGGRNEHISFYAARDLFA